MKHIVKYNELFNFFKKKEIMEDDIITINDLFLEISDELDIEEYILPYCISTNMKYSNFIQTKEKSQRDQKNTYSIYKIDKDICIDIILYSVIIETPNNIGYHELEALRRQGRSSNEEEKKLNSMIGKFMNRLKRFKFKSSISVPEEYPELTRIIIYK